MGMEVDPHGLVGDSHPGLLAQVIGEQLGRPVGGFLTHRRAGSSSITRSNSASQADVIARSRPGEVRRGTASNPPDKKRLSTRATVSSLRNTISAMCGAVWPNWASTSI